MKYLANDGTVFEKEIECVRYEYEQSLAHSVEALRVSNLKKELQQWLDEHNVELGFWAESDGDDTNGVYLYSATDEKAQTTIWSDDE